MCVNALMYDFYNMLMYVWYNALMYVCHNALKNVWCNALMYVCHNVPIQAIHEDEDEAMEEGVRLVSGILGQDKLHLYPRILQLVMADGAWTEGRGHVRSQGVGQRSQGGGQGSQGGGQSSQDGGH